MVVLEKNIENSHRNGLDILLIDDNEQISNMLHTFLTLEGHSCMVSNDGQEGLNLIQTKKFDIILLDLAIPDFDGFDIINALEKNKKINENKINF